MTGGLKDDRLSIEAYFRRLNALWNNSAIMAGVFILRITITLLSFALITLAARAMTLSAFGTYSILFSAAGLFCILATVGQQILLMRSWNEYSASGQIGLLMAWTSRRGWSKEICFGGADVRSGSCVTKRSRFERLRATL